MTMGYFARLLYRWQVWILCCWHFRRLGGKIHLSVTRHSDHAWEVNIAHVWPVPPRVSRQTWIWWVPADRCWVLSHRPLEKFASLSAAIYAWMVEVSENRPPRSLADLSAEERRDVLREANGEGGME